jgi:hypothetical protein
MAKVAAPTLSVSELFAERDARRHRDKEAEEQLQRRKDEELADFRKRLDNFQLTDEVIQSGLQRIRRAFERGETELMITSFPSTFCTDNGRLINNADAPPISKPSNTKETDPEWLMTLPMGARLVYDFWKEHLKPGGFHFGARIINYPGGKPGDVGLFFSWPKTSLDIESQSRS